MESSRFRIYIAASLDGFIATADGGVEWLEPFNAQVCGYDAFLSSVHSLVVEGSDRATQPSRFSNGP